MSFGFFSEIESSLNTKLGKIFKTFDKHFLETLASGENSTFLASNHIQFGIRPFYFFSFNIPETFKKGIISLEENKCRTHTGDQL